ncbi:MAG: NAD-dependent epimerase/dehydratase family protein [Methanococcaceae archaeon]
MIYGNSKPIIVSGGDGFIGKNLVKKILSLEIPVIVIDNHVTSFPVEIDSPLFTRVIEDVSELNIDTIPKTSGVIHLASVAAPSDYMMDPLLALKPNSLGTRKMIEIAERDCVRILFASTSEVYGHLTENAVAHGRIKEDDTALITLLSKRSCYSSSKRFGEELILNFKRSGGDGTNLRFFNVYGPGMDLKNLGYGRVIPNFFYNVNHGIPLTVYGDGNQVRSFLWINDAIEAILSVYFFEGTLPEALNIGNDEPIKIIELADKISKVLNKGHQLKFCVRERDDPVWRRPCIELINKLTGWKPNVGLEEGLQIIAKEGKYV